MGPAAADVVPGEAEVGEAEVGVAEAVPGVYGGKLAKHTGGSPLDGLVQPGPRLVIRPSCRASKWAVAVTFAKLSAGSTTPKTRTPKRRASRTRKECIVCSCLENAVEVNGKEKYWEKSFYRDSNFPMQSQHKSRAFRHDTKDYGRRIFCCVPH